MEAASLEGTRVAVDDEGLHAALSHPVRRAILATMLKEGGLVRSPKELTNELPLAGQLSTLSYHVRVLAKCGALSLVREEPRRGAFEHFYVIPDEVARVPWLRGSLGLPPMIQVDSGG
jgi:DNA-binding transcriptional ArsR family regulator